VRLNIKEMELKKKKTREKEEILLALQGFRILRSLILCWGHHQNVGSPPKCAKFVKIHFNAYT
jgi:hypothetical protein